MASTNLESIRRLDQSKQHERASRAFGSIRGMKWVVAAGLVCMTLFGATEPASASFSAFVNVQPMPFRAPAADCLAEAGAHWRADGLSQGEAKVTCSLRHARTVVSVRLFRWNGTTWVALPWSTYTFNNSFGTGAAHIVTQPSGICGYAKWFTEVQATVTTGTLNNGVFFDNQVQNYDPCA